MNQPERSGCAFASFCGSTVRRIRPVCMAVLCFFAVNAVAGTASRGETLFDEVIEETASRHGVDPLLVKAIIWKESEFQPDKTGSAGEIGLMQIRMPAVQDWAEACGKELPCEEELFDPALNIEVGTWYIARALRRWDDHPDALRLALGEYNAGRGRLLRWLRGNGNDSDSVMRSTKTGIYAERIREKYFEYASAIDFRALAYFDPQPEMPKL